MFPAYHLRNFGLVGKSLGITGSMLSERDDNFRTPEHARYVHDVAGRAVAAVFHRCDGMARAHHSHPRIRTVHGWRFARWRFADVARSASEQIFSLVHRPA